MKSQQFILQMSVMKFYYRNCISQPYFTSSPLPHSGEVDNSLLSCASPRLEVSWTTSVDTAKWFGFKIVGDNIDKTVRPRHETMASHNQSLHYFHCYAVHDRVNLSSFSDEPTQVDTHLFSPEVLLPSKGDLSKILQNFAVLITRVVVAYLPCFKSFSAVVVKHIPHRFSSEMSKKSDNFHDIMHGFKLYIIVCRCPLECI